jgi:hypothetical protein
MSEFVMPEVQLGDWVLFYPHQGAEPNTAVVTRVSARVLSLWVIAPGGGVEKTSVHHVNDTALEEFPDWKRYGLWDLRPRDPKLAILAEKVALLEKKLDALEPKKSK